jgi:hypothetical protein
MVIPRRVRFRPSAEDSEVLVNVVLTVLLATTVLTLSVTIGAVSVALPV